MTGTRAQGMEEMVVAEPWQLQLFRRSLKKRQTVDALLGHLPPVEGRLCLEVGCGTGLTSHFLRERGGTWVSCDFERDHVRSAKQLVGDRVLQISDRQLPFKTRRVRRGRGDQFPRAHQGRRDASSPRWCACSSPAAISCSWRPRATTGGPASRSSARSASRPPRRASATRATATRSPAARALMERHGIRVQGQETYCRLFTESLEDLLNYAYHRKAMEGKDTEQQDFHGDTAPMSADALNKVGTAYKVYSAVYPALRAWTMLDRLIPFSEGYMMVAWGKKAA